MCVFIYIYIYIFAYVYLDKSKWHVVSCRDTLVFGFVKSTTHILNDREVGFAAKRSRRAYPWNLVGEDRSAGVLSFYLLYFSITILNMTILRALTRLSATFSPPKIGDETGDFETFTYIYQIISHYQHPPKLGLHSTNHHSRLPQISGTE